MHGFDVTIATPLYITKDKFEKEHNFTMRPFSPFYMHRKVRFRMLKYFAYSILSIFNLFILLRKNNYDVVYVNNSIIAFSFLFIKLFIKIPLVLRYTDFLSGFLYEDKKYPRFIVNILKYYEYRVAKIFDRVYVITEKMKNELHKVGKIELKKIVVTLDGIDDTIFNKDKIPENNRIELRERLNIPLNATLVMCHGTIEPHHGEYIIPEIVENITHSTNDFYFILIGVGKGYQTIKNALKNNEKVRTLDFIDYHNIPKYIDTSDIGIIPYQKNHSMDLVLTLKLLEYLSMGTPCVLFDLASVRRVFGKYNFVKISNGMKEFTNNIFSLKDFGKSDDAADLIEKRFTWEKVGETIANDIAFLLNLKGKEDDERSC